MRAKICGITNLKDALLAVNSGAWALGFNFHPKSPRFITPKAAKNIIEALKKRGPTPPSVIMVGIFIDQPMAVIEHGLDTIGLDLAQVYSIFNAPISLKQRMILSLTIESEVHLPAPEVCNEYKYILLDASYNQKSEKTCLQGGTGRQANWVLAKSLAKEYRLILAGGLSVDNVETAIKSVNPYAVDVASGLECSPGIKNKQLLDLFLKTTKEHQTK